MKAVVFERTGAPLVVRDVPPPALGTGEVIVDVFAARVLSYAGEVFGGQRTYPFDLPAVPGPGPIGRVRAIGNDSTKLKVGDWVFCDPTIRARDDALTPDIMLQGLIAPGPGPKRLRAWVGDGGWAEQIRRSDWSTPTRRCNGVPWAPSSCRSEDCWRLNCRRVRRC
jgi:alcohol dehydrogenase